MIIEINDIEEKKKVLGCKVLWLKYTKWNN